MATVVSDKEVKKTKSKYNIDSYYTIFPPANKDLL